MLINVDKDVPPKIPKRTVWKVNNTVVQPKVQVVRELKFLKGL